MGKFSHVCFAVALGFWGDVLWSVERIAVASNFAETLKELLGTYNGNYNDHCSLTVASSGKLYFQIVQGAPYHLFLSADRTYTEKLVASGLAKRSLPYAQGRLVFWSPRGVENWRARLRQKAYANVAIANPAFAPYGMTADHVLRTLQAATRIVVAENVAQVFHWVVSGNVAGGFVSLAQVRSQKIDQDQYVTTDHPPIHQEMVVLRQGQFTKGFAQFLQSKKTHTLLQRAGYRVP